jgi:hypothetical protein
MTHFKIINPFIISTIQQRGLMFFVFILIPGMLNALDSSATIAEIAIGPSATSIAPISLNYPSNQDKNESFQQSITINYYQNSINDTGKNEERISSSNSNETIIAVIHNISSIIWPIAIIIIIILFKNNIRDLIKRLKKSKIGNSEIEFDTENRLNEILDKTSKNNEIIDLVNNKPFYEIAIQDSRSAIITSWLELEESIFTMYYRKYPTMTAGISENHIA